MNKLLGKISQLSINKKMLWAVLSAVFLSNVVSTTILSVYDYNTSEKAFIKEIKILTELTAKRSSASLVFKDPRVAQSNLDSLVSHPAIDKVCLYTKNKTLFSSSLKEHTPNHVISDCTLQWQESSKGLMLSLAALTITQAVNMQNKVVGHLVVQANLNSLNHKAFTLIGIAITAFILAMCTALLTINRIQQFITQPILKLNKTIQSIRSNKNFGQRAKQDYADEVGDLVDSFNNLLFTIEDHDQTLQSIMQELVEQRDESDQNAQAALRRKELLQEFVASASHDLKQPTQAIALYINQLKTHTEAKQQEIILTKLDNTVDNLNSLFKEILDASKLEAQLNRNKHITRVDLQNLLLKLHEEFEPKAQQKNIDLRLFCEHHFVLSDSIMLERILRNLMSNAIRYTEKGGVLIAARKRSDHISLEVWDTGLGIGKDNIDDIFIAYKQDETGSLHQAKELRQNEGVGLGLSIVKKMADTLNNELSVSSIEHQGSVFKLRLTRDKANNAFSPANNITAFKSEHSNNSNIRHNLNDLHVLLIDDDLKILLALEETLTQWGMQCQYAANVAEALYHIHRGFVPDAIVSDFNLGKENGFELIRAIEDIIKIRVCTIIISAENSQDFHQYIADAGYTLLPKPVKPEALRQTLLSQLSHHN